jgi:hypothetical protein
VTPGERFAHMIETVFGLAHLGLVNSKGIPHPLQLALFAQEFSDVIEFRSPPAAVQRTPLSQSRQAVSHGSCTKWARTFLENGRVFVEMPRLRRTMSSPAFSPPLSPALDPAAGRG